MEIMFHDSNFKHIANSNLSQAQLLSQSVLETQGCAQAKTEITAWPGYQSTPLLDLRGLASACGVDKLWYKDEGPRFGLKSFKALGGAYAVSQILIKEIERATGEQATTDDLIAGRYVAITQTVTVSCATDGNHGRSVAWGAHKFGCQCVIFIHATVSEDRKQAIESFGATIVRTDSNYDDSVRQAAADAQKFDRVVVSDTSYPGYMEIPKYVMQGYTVIADEIINQLENKQLPTHVFLQGGVGGFAAAISARLCQIMGSKRPRIVICEPDQAACIYESIKAGEPISVAGNLDTIMAGLACGEVSLLAWEVLKPGIDDVLVVSDACAKKCMRLLATGADADAPIVAGESAVAGLAGMLCAIDDGDIAMKIGLDAHSRVLIIGTEGATDEDVYRQIVGRSSDQVNSE